MININTLTFEEKVELLKELVNNTIIRVTNGDIDEYIRSENITLGQPNYNNSSDPPIIITI